MWDIKLKVTNMTTKQTLMDTNSELVVTSGKGEEGGREGISYVMTEGNLTLGAEHTMQYTYDVLLNCTLETCMILLTHVTSIILT